MKTKQAIFHILIAAVLIQMTILATIFIKQAKIKPLPEYAQQIIQECKDKPYRPSCYDEAIPKLMDQISITEAFEVTKLVQEIDGDYWYCHILGHNLSAREVSKDPKNWQDALSKCPSGVCSNGCLHGGLQEKFRAETLSEDQIEKAVKDLDGLCEKKDGWDPTGLEKASCYHAVGHLAIYIANANIDKSIKICDELAYKNEENDYLQTCYEGVFMQIFQPLEDEDFTLVEGITPAKNDLATFCNQYEPDKKEACWREGWPLYWSEIQTPTGMVSFCNRNTEESQVKCYNSMFYVYTAQKNLKPESVIDFCSQLPKKVIAQCFGNAASRMIETDYRMIDRSVELCNSAKDFGVEDRCFQELLFYSTFNFHKDSPEFYKLCNALPDSWKANCLAGNTTSPEIDN